MQSPQYALRSKKATLVQPSECIRMRKRGKPAKPSKEHESSDSTSSRSSSSSTASESQSTTITSISNGLRRKERSETYSSYSSETPTSIDSSTTSDEESLHSDYHPSASIEQEPLTPDYTGSTLSREIQTDDSLFKWLSSKGLLANGLSCPVHSVDLEVQMKTIKGNQTFLWACPQKGCTIQLPITTNTIFMLFRAHPRQILYVILDWLLGHQRNEATISSGLTKNTISRANIILRVCAYIIISRSPQTIIGGEGTVVEIDEAELHRRKAKRGRIKQAGWVVGGVQRGPAGSIKPCFFELVENRSSAVLLEAIRRHVKPNTTIVTDAWKGYAALDLPTSEYTHAIINHATRFSDGAGIYTQTIEGIWHHLRRSALPSHGCSIVDIEYYICQHMLRKVTGLNLVHTIQLLNSVDREEVKKHLKQRRRLIRREKKLAHKWKKEQRRKKEIHQMKHLKSLSQEQLNKTLPDNIRQLLADSSDVQKRAKASSAKMTYDRLKKVQDGILPKKN